MPSRIFIPEHVVAVAFRLREQGKSWTEVAKATGCSVMGLRRRLDPDYHEKINVYHAKRMREYRARLPTTGKVGRFAGGVGHPGSRDIPPEVLAERDRVSRAAPASLTAEILGDPPPGRSALDKRRLHEVKP